MPRPRYCKVKRVRPVGEDHDDLPLQRDISPLDDPVIALDFTPFLLSKLLSLPVASRSDTGKTKATPTAWPLIATAGCLTALQQLLQL